MARVREIAAYTRARPRRRRLHRRVLTQTRPGLSSSPPPKRPRSHRLRDRLLLALAISAAIHALILLLGTKTPKPPEKKDVIQFTFNERTPDLQKGRDIPAPVQPAPKHPPKTKEVKPTPPNRPHDEVDKPPEQVPDTAYAQNPTPQTAVPEKQATGGNVGESSGPKNGPQAQPDPSHVQLFTPDALGTTVQRWKESMPSADQFTAPNAIGDGNSPEAVKARISARIAGDADQAEANGRVAGGLISACNDGHDNNFDGVMDCADLGCRLLPVCRNTKEFHNTQQVEIPDNDTRGITTEVNVNDDDLQTITGVSLSVHLVHDSPGDLYLEVEHDGHKQKLQLADPDIHRFPVAFYLQDFIGRKAQGVWKLKIVDVHPGTSGRLRNWVLFVTRPNEGDKLIP